MRCRRSIPPRREIWLRDPVRAGRGGSCRVQHRAGVWVTVGEVEDLALVAFADVEERWPAQDVVLGWPEPTEDTWTAFCPCGSHSDRRVGQRQRPVSDTGTC